MTSRIPRREVTLRLVDSLAKLERTDRELEVYEHQPRPGTAPSFSWVLNRRADVEDFRRAVDAFGDFHPGAPIGSQLSQDVQALNRAIEEFDSMARRGSSFSHGMGQVYDRSLQHVRTAI